MRARSASFNECSRQLQRTLGVTRREPRLAAQEEKDSPRSSDEEHVTRDLSPKPEGLLGTIGIHLSRLGDLNAAVAKESGSGSDGDSKDERPSEYDDRPSDHVRGQVENPRRAEPSAVPNIRADDNRDTKQEVLELKHRVQGVRLTLAFSCEAQNNLRARRASIP